MTSGRDGPGAAWKLSEPVLFLDALVLKIRDGGSVQRKACYLALAIGIDGEREVLGMWFQANEGAKFWMQVLTDLKQRGVQDILICCVDGLKGFPEAIEAVFPQTTVQTCIVHLIRHSLKYVPRRQYDAVVKDLKPIYTAIDADHALRALEAFEEKWRQQLPVIGQAWRDAWEYVTRSWPSNPRSVADQRDRGAQPTTTKGDQDQGPLPDRGRGPQTDLPRNPKRCPAMDPNQGVDESPPRVQDPIRRPPTRLTHQPPHVGPHLDRRQRRAVRDPREVDRHDIRRGLRRPL
jgi:hypothetical protein